MNNRLRISIRGNEWLFGFSFYPRPNEDYFGTPWVFAIYIGPFAFSLEGKDLDE